MTRYKVRLSEAAKLDVVGIISYLLNLAGGITARRYSVYFDSAFKKLESIGAGMAVLGRFGRQGLEIRKIRVKRYVVYYTVDEESRSILVVRVVHGSMDRDKLFR